MRILKAFILSLALMATIALPQFTSAATVEKDKPVRQSEGTIRQRAHARPLPAYPQEAKDKMIEGDVVVDVVIDEQGNIIKEAIVSGPEVFYETVLQAVAGWKFEPYEVDGQAVKVSGQLTFRFLLN